MNVLKINFKWALNDIKESYPRFHKQGLNLVLD